jgi:GH15 family glucan-1,4-alpha-glucosidase
MYRYVSEDDFGIPENAFTICSFWYVSALARQKGREGEARALFERLLCCRNHVGLLSEDIDTKTGELWGNFPQTYSMVGLINCAISLSKTWEEVGIY